jgi:hypothetical protein
LDAFARGGHTRGEGVLRAGYKFPPARGRVGFELRENGEFVYHDIARGDGVQKVLGRWEAKSDGEIVASFADNERRPLTLVIVSIDRQVLKIKK